MLHPPHVVHVQPVCLLLLLLLLLEPLQHQQYHHQQQQAARLAAAVAPRPVQEHGVRPHQLAAAGALGSWHALQTAAAGS